MTKPVCMYEKRVGGWERGKVRERRRGNDALANIRLVVKTLVKHW